ncbi:MAG: hypothetical protein WCH44_13340 [Betaproteobacteria bacterium]
MKLAAKPTQPVPAFVPTAPDAIMAELWSTKQRINAQADYDIDKLLARVKREAGRNSVQRVDLAPHAAQRRVSAQPD